MDARIRDQVGLELSHVNIQCSVKTKGSRQRRDHLSNQAVKVGVGRTLNIEVAAANIVSERTFDEVDG